MNNRRRCCNSSKGEGSHEASCPNGMARIPTLREDLDRAQVDKSVRIEILQEVYGDLPDGAFWAVAEEFRLEPQDF